MMEEAVCASTVIDDFEYLRGRHKLLLCPVFPLLPELRVVTDSSSRCCQ